MLFVFRGATTIIGRIFFGLSIFCFVSKSFKFLQNRVLWKRRDKFWCKIVNPYGKSRNSLRNELKTRHTMIHYAFGGFSNTIATQEWWKQVINKWNFSEFSEVLSTMEWEQNEFQTSKTNSIKGDSKNISNLKSWLNILLGWNSND